MSNDNQQNDRHFTRRDYLVSEPRNRLDRSTRLDGSAPTRNHPSARIKTVSDSDFKDFQRPLPPRLASFYEVIESLPTEGAEADLYLVKDCSSDERYILKLYRQNVTPKENVAKNIQVLSKEHPNYFIQIIEYSYSSQLSYEILEYLPEGSLAAFFAKQKKLNENQILSILKQLSSAIHILHQNGIVHRDLKPSNVLIRQESPLKLALIDFGISSILYDATRGLTNLNATVYYASPEALFAGDVSAWSDFWSLGMVIVELLMGSHPFSSSSEQAVKSAISQRSIDLSAIADDRWRRLCQGLLLRDSEHRWGKKQVAQWLNGENPAVVGDSYSTATVSPYKLEGEEYYTPEELAIGLSKHWDEGIKRLERGRISKWLDNDLKDDDLYLQIEAIENDQTKDSDLKLLLAIAVLAPKLPPIYKRYSLTKDGLLSIIKSGDLNTVDWLYNNQILKKYGVLTKKKSYVSMHESWESLVFSFSTLVKTIKYPGRLSDQIINTCSSSSHLRAELLKLSISSQCREILKGTIKKEVSPDAQRCNWFQSLNSENVEQAPVENLYAMLLLKSIAEEETQLKDEQARLRKKQLRTQRIERATKIGTKLLLVSGLITGGAIAVFQLKSHPISIDLNFEPAQKIKRSANRRRNYIEHDWQFPMEFCGTAYPEDFTPFYRVFARVKSKTSGPAWTSREYIVNSYCHSAFSGTARSYNASVAVFDTMAEAEKFARVLKRDRKIKSLKIFVEQQSLCQAYFTNLHPDITRYEIKIKVDGGRIGDELESYLKTKYNCYAQSSIGGHVEVGSFDSRDMAEKVLNILREDSFITDRATESIRVADNRGFW